ncbi:MAG: WD40 repeat domain-containing serine/threonine protein kinase [Planctomycetota bacterium]
MADGLSAGGTMGGPGAPGAGAWALEGGDLVGGYRIVKALGRGGMGEVYLAENVEMGKRYALKLLPRDMTDAQGRRAVFMERFRREARVMADLNHPNIVDVHHMAEDAGRYFLVMDYVEGPTGTPRTLSDEIAERGALTPDDARRTALELADALAAAHAKGVLHRDLKPGNVLLDAEGRARLTDFGLAKVLGSDEGTPGADAEGALSSPGTLGGATQPGSALGTPGYMSPEQERGEELDERSDVFALGEVVYAMLFGHRPSGIPAMPSARGLPAGWDAVVRGCLAENPDDRFAGASEVAEALRASDAPALPARREDDVPPAAPADAPGEHRPSGADRADDDEPDPVLEAAAGGGDRARRRRRRRVWLAAAAGAVALWATRDVWTQPRSTTLRGHEGGVKAVVFSPEGDRLATSGADGTVALWRLNGPGPAPTAERRLDAGEGGVTSLAWTRGGDLLAAGNEYHTVSVWRAGDGSKLGTLADHEGAVRSIAVSPDGGTLASVGADGSLFLWSVSKGARLADDRPDGTPTCVAFSPAGDAFVVGHSGTGFLGRKGFATLRDAATCEVTHTFGGENHVVAAAFSPDGAYLATAERSQGILGWSSSVRLWNVASRKELRALDCGKGNVTCVVFSPDGRHVATGSEDETASVWDFSSGRRTIRLGTLVSGHGGAVRAVAFSPDGRALATAGDDGTVRVWDLADRLEPGGGVR